MLSLTTYPDLLCSSFSCAASVLFQDIKCRYDGPVPATCEQLGRSGVELGSLQRVCVLDAVYKAAREQPGPAVPLQCAFEPAVLPLSVNKHNVALLKFQLGLALRRI